MKRLLEQAAALLFAAAAAHASAHLTARDLSQSVGFDAALGAHVPLDARFVDEAGHSITLADAIGARPALLALVDYACTDLCPITLDALADTLPDIDLAAGRDFDVIAVGIDIASTPQEAAQARDALAHRAKHAGRSAVPLAGWHFLTGSAGVARLAGAVGFRYRRDDESGRFAHPAGVVVLTPRGTISGYFFGARFAPRALRYAIVEASHGTVGSLPDRIWLLCHAFDPQTGRYRLVALDAVRGVAIASALALAVAIGWLSGVGRTRSRDRAGAR